MLFGSLVRILLMIDIMGVIPEPPANMIRWRFLSAEYSVVNWPMGSITLIFAPFLRLSESQLESNPPSTRFTVTARSRSTNGEVHSEYDLLTSLPLTGAISVRNCPDLYWMGPVAGCSNTMEIVSGVSFTMSLTTSSWYRGPA